MTFVQEVHRYFDQLPQYAWIMKLWKLRHWYFMLKLLIFFIMEINMHKSLRKLKCPSTFYESEEDVYQFAMHSQEIVGWKQWIWLVNLHVQTNSKPSESTKA
jgi:hypothetical protein